MPTSLIEECHRRACEARRSAETASMPSRKANFLEMEQRWLLAARSVAPKSIEQRKEPMTQQTIQLKTAPFKGRPTKFTPERIQQIKNLVAQGKSREEIAGLIGVTVGSLQVTCSKLGISLRRPRVNPQNDLPGQDPWLLRAGQAWRGGIGLAVKSSCGEARDMSQPMDDSAV